MEIPNHGEELEPAVNYFDYFFDGTFLEEVIDFSNAYCLSTTGKSLDLTLQELNAFLGVWMYMGVCKLPNIKDYWNSATRVSQVADTLTLKRFMKIKGNLHFCNNDNTEAAKADRYFKVRSLISHMQNKCRQLDQESRFSIDETMIPYKGTYAGGLRQYVKKKPIKWGFKFYTLAGVSGMVYYFMPYGGSQTFRDNELNSEVTKMGFGASVVTELCKLIDSPESSIVVFDNFFTGLPLLQYLKKEMNILALGTIKANRVEQCPLTDATDFLKRPRGSSESFVNKDEVVVVRWCDNKVVTLASTAVGVEPKGKAKR